MLFSSGIFDVVTPSTPAETLPVRLALTPDRARTTARLLLIIPGLGVLLVPAAIAVYLLAQADAAMLLGQDGVTFAALAGLPLVWLAVAAAAALSVLPRLRRKRLVTISADEVFAIETGLLGARSWNLPVRTYRGIAHHVRASAGVVTHEIILVHADPDHSLLLHTAPIVNQTSLDQYAALLRLPVIPAREVYRVQIPAMAVPGLGLLRRMAGAVVKPA